MRRVFLFRDILPSFLAFSLFVFLDFGSDQPNLVLSGFHSDEPKSLLDPVIACYFVTKISYKNATFVVYSNLFTN